MNGQVRARIGYVGPMIEPPVSAAADPEMRSTMVWDWREVPIGNGRDIAGGARLESHGFTVLPHESRVSRHDETLAWRVEYAIELETLFRRMTGADDVLVATMKWGEGEDESAPAVRLGSTRLAGASGTVDFCHNDYTAASVGRHIAEIDPARAEERLSRRFAIYNTWRLVSPLPQDKPLAVCDPRSIAIADLVPGDTYYYDEIYHPNALFRYNPAHRWYYYPDLRPDELLVFAGYDSDPAVPSIVPHCAFEDPQCTDPEACRISVDCRVFVFFDS